LDHKTETFTIPNPNNDPKIARFIEVMGNKVEVVSTIWAEDDIDKDYTFPNRGPQTVAWGGDDAIGAITGAYIDEDDKLIGVFNFGDEGNFEVDIHEGQEALYILGDL